MPQCDFLVFYLVVVLVNIPMESNGQGWVRLLFTGSYRSSSGF